jgi:signal transduction histidine kinase
MSKSVQVSVKDEGLGIKEKDLANLFNRYYRVESPNKQQVAGFGIGLYLSSEIVQAHRGKIWVESEFSKGSTFYFSLPIAYN